jgi:hypothetical protein
MRFIAKVNKKSPCVNDGYVMLVITDNKMKSRILLLNSFRTKRKKQTTIIPTPIY